MLDTARQPWTEPGTEAELCDALARVAPADGWDVFPEVGGFDLVLVWNGTKESRRLGSDPVVPVGFQFGIDAKLRANVDVLAQCLRRMERRCRPDLGGVLVPDASQPFMEIAARLGVRVLTLQHCRAPRDADPGHWNRVRTEISTIEPLTLRYLPPRGEPGRLTLPPVPLQSSGGQASPRVLSPWRVSALRVCNLIRANGSVTREQGKALGIDLSDWVGRFWLDTDGKRPASYTPGPRWETSGPHVGYEAERDALAAKDATTSASAPGASSSLSSHASTVPAPLGAPAGARGAPGCGESGSRGGA